MALKPLILDLPLPAEEIRALDEAAPGQTFWQYGDQRVHRQSNSQTISFAAISTSRREFTWMLGKTRCWNVGKKGYLLRFELDDWR